MKLLLRNGKVLRSSTTGAMLAVEKERPPLQEQIDQLEEQLENASIYPGNTGKDGRDGKDGADGKDGKDGIDGKDGNGFIPAPDDDFESDVVSPNCEITRSACSAISTPKAGDTLVDSCGYLFYVTEVTETHIIGTKLAVTIAGADGTDGSSTEYNQLRVDYEAVQTVHYDGDTIYWDTILKMEDEDSEEVDRKDINIQLPIIAGNGIEFTPNQDGSRMTINATGGGSSLTMPIIRMGSATDVNNTMVISNDNPLTFTVEVIGGELQVGDLLQICAVRLCTYYNEEAPAERIRKYKMRKFAQYEVTAEDLEKRYISVSTNAAPYALKELLRGGGKSTSTVHNYYTKYLRIRRVHPDNASDSLFSNAVPFQVFGKYDKENDCSLGRVSIR